MPEPTTETRWVRNCCYTGMFIQAMVINLTPLFFIPLRAQFGLTFEQLGRLVLVNFTTQMLVDLACTAILDRRATWVKPLTVAAQLFAAAGLWLFAAAPTLFPATPYHGLLLGTVAFSLGCGLLEVLISPIVNALPSSRKAADMALLHAFYPIGKVVVIGVTAAALYAFGNPVWRTLAVAWSAIPLLNAAGFLSATLPPFVHEAQRQRTRTMARTRSFWLLLFGILLAGSTEVTLAQWTSAFAQASLGLSQGVADCLGFGLFGAMMILGRLWFGFRGHGRALPPLLLRGALGSVACYAVVALSPWPAVSLAACVAAGWTVSMLWPGIVSLSAAAFPKAGVSLFALLAAFGDTGAGMGPWCVGAIADAVGAAQRLGTTVWAGILPSNLAPDQLGLRAGLLVAGLCPLLLAGILHRLRPQVFGQ